MKESWISEACFPCPSRQRGESTEKIQIELFALSPTPKVLQQSETRKWDHVGGREAAVAERLGKLSSKSTTHYSEVSVSALTVSNKNSRKM